MRKPRDYDTELKALNDRAKLLRDRKLTQLGELTVATCADALPVEMLVGVLLAAADTKDAATKEAWRKRGAAFFQRTARGNAIHGDRSVGSGATDDSSAKSPAAGASAS